MLKYKLKRNQLEKKNYEIVIRWPVEVSNTKFKSNNKLQRMKNNN